MNSYIDYDYYEDTFGGSLIPEEMFDKYSVKASNEVRIRIFNRDITNCKDLVKTSTCSIAELIYNQDKIKEKIQNIALGNDVVVTSEKVGDYSRNINNTSIDDLKMLASEDTLSAQINEELEKSLLYTGLLYRGINVQ